MPGRTYDQREIAAILARASAEDRPGPDGPGLTLEEIERAAAESGLDPARVRRAAAELDAGLLEAAASRPGTAVAERWVEGPVPAAAWEDAVAALRLRVGAPAGAADTSALGEAREWVHASPFGGTTTVTVSPRGGRTRVRVVRQDGVGNARLLATALGALASTVVGMLAGATVAEALELGDLWGVVTVVAVVVVGTAVLSEVLTRRTHAGRARQAREVEALADDLARALGAGLEAPGATTETDSGLEARIDPALLDAEPEDAEGRADRASRRTRG